MTKKPTPPNAGKYVIIAATIAAFATLLAATAGWKNCGGTQPPPKAEASITGRIVNVRTEEPVRKARVSVEAGGVPDNTESDSMGIFTATLPADASSVRIRVTARGFKPYDQNLPRQLTAQVIPVNLEPERAAVDGRGSKAPDVPNIVQKTTHASMLDLSLPRGSGASAPWSVIVFGQQERRDEVGSAVRSALSGSGRDTISIFRKTSDEQRLAPELFRGQHGLFDELQAGQFCSRLLVAKLTVSRIGATEGITFANATLSVRVMSPDGETLKSFDLSEKGGGEDETSARRHAVDELIDALPRQLPEKLN